MRWSGEWREERKVQWGVGGGKTISKLRLAQHTVSALSVSTTAGQLSPPKMAASHLSHPVHAP